MGAAGSGGPLLAPGALESVLHLLEGAHALVSRGRRGRLHFREVCSGGWRRELEVEFVVSPRRRIGVALQEEFTEKITSMLVTIFYVCNRGMSMITTVIERLSSSQNMTWIDVCYHQEHVGRYAIKIWLFHDVQTFAVKESKCCIHHNAKVSNNVISQIIARRSAVFFVSFQSLNKEENLAHPRAASTSHTSKSINVMALQWLHNVGNVYLFHVRDMLSHSLVRCHKFGILIGMVEYNLTTPKIRSFIINVSGER
ncbi:hypothetical protein MUK42_37336 [Musa troglodytarum]|uniref:Uncharacterized protein n=1 Tax=Musa troglodytarum TaxID=320322 RepID=A0A9E7GHU1_9LILI|nr:hypothetical protein MUK42_37336 [Musa troglodytarum]